MPPPLQPQRQQVFAPSIGVGAFQTFAQALAERQRRRQEQQDALALLVAKQRLEEEATERSPERLVQRLGLQRGIEAGRVPQPLGGFSPQEQQLGLPQQIEEAATNRMAQVLKRFGLVKPDSDILRFLRESKLQQEISSQASKEETERQTRQRESQFIRDSAVDALETVDEVEQGLQHFGVFGGLPSFPGTARAKWEANINKLLSGKIVDLMSEMKRVSKTGATGFGQLNREELKVLQEASTALKRGLRPSDAQEILNKMKEKLHKIAQGNTGGASDPLGIR